MLKQIEERIQAIVDNEHLTLDAKLNAIMDIRLKYDEIFDQVMESIDDSYKVLEDKRCPFCEGLGVYQFREYIDKCTHCNGTGVCND